MNEESRGGSKINKIIEYCREAIKNKMNRLAVGSVWQSMYFLGLGMSDLQSLAENWIKWVKICPVDPELYSGQDRHTHTQHTRTVGNPKSGDGSQNLCQTMIELLFNFGRVHFATIGGNHA